jgi:hypothetical protein
MLVVRFPSGNSDMIRDVKTVKRMPRHSFAPIDHQIAALSQENRQARPLG